MMKFVLGVCMRTKNVYIIKRKLPSGLKIWILFSCGEKQYFTHSLCTFVKYCFHQEKIKFIFAPPCYQGFWYFAQSRTREIQVFPRNPAKYREIRQKYFQILVGKTYLILILAIRPVLFTPNVQIYLETSSLQRVNNVPKLPGVFRWTLRKTGH